MNDKEHFDISEEEASYFSIIPPLAMSFSCVIFPKLADSIGRKPTLLIVAFPQLAAWILTAVGTNVYFFYACRFCSGLSTSCVFSVLPIYISEVISPKIRGTFGCFVTSMHFTGQFVINVLGNYFDVKTTAYICAPTVLLFFLLFLLMPETPYYYAMKNMEHKTKLTLQRVLRKFNVDHEFECLTKDVASQMSEKGSWKELFTNESNRKALLIATLLRITQQLGGDTVFASSIRYVFENAGGAVRSDVATLVFTFSIIPFYSSAGFLVDKIGRKPAFTLSVLLTSIILLAESAYFYVVTRDPDMEIGILNWFPFVGMMFYVIASSFGPGVVPTLVIGEIFSVNIKSQATIIAILMFGVSSYLAHELFFLVNSYIGLVGPFFLFGVVNFCAAFFGCFYLPETKGKTLGEIQQYLKESKQFRSG